MSSIILIENLLSNLALNAENNYIQILKSSVETAIAQQVHLKKDIKLIL